MGLQTKNTKYSIENGLALAQASALAYSDANAFQDGIGQIVGLQLQELRVLANVHYDTHVYMARFDDAILVSFEGTKSAQNWLTDFEIHLVPFKAGGMVHLGFQTALTTVFPQIIRNLDDWAGGGRTLWLTGHSLGGALAMLLAAYLRLPGDQANRLPTPIAGIYTFGQPRVGTREFCDVCSGSFGRFYFRFVNNEDIVTRVPPRLLAYWHLDNVEYITADKAIVADPAWWYIFLDRVKAGRSALEELRVAAPLVALVSDHAIRVYVEAIAAQVGATVSTSLPDGV